MSLRALLAGCLTSAGLIVALSTNTVPALACSCAVTPSPGPAAAPGELTFLGRVKTIAPAAVGSDLNRVSFATRESGDAYTADRFVLTPRLGGACGYPFAVGITYEVHATIANGALVTNSCSGTHVSIRSIPFVGYPQDPVPQHPAIVAIFAGLRSPIEVFVVGLILLLALATGGVTLIGRLLRT